VYGIFLVEFTMPEIIKESPPPNDMLGTRALHDKVRNISGVQGNIESKPCAELDTKIQVDEKNINKLLKCDPEVTSPDDGRKYHKLIQEDLIKKGDYEESEVIAKDINSEACRRIREVIRGPKAGTLVDEGTIYDLFTESDKTISTAEIKPFSPTGIAAADEKLKKQTDIEENFGGNHGGKKINRELIFYDPRNGQVVLKGEANPTLEQAKIYSKNWRKQ
jgi:Holliday junction resolvase